MKIDIEMKHVFDMLYISIMYHSKIENFLWFINVAMLIRQNERLVFANTFNFIFSCYS